uniref:Toll-like receptor 2 n=1 Tax=Myripristis murdjan TaxID=586833 RepID=A0A668A5F3_9TELE
MGRPPSLPFVLLLFLPCLSRAHRSNPEDEKPSCDRCDRRLSCNCTYGGFTRVPTVTDGALTLDLSFNNISEVTDDDLIGHAHLRALSLHGNTLTVIQPSAFDALWNLEELDLSNNRLTALNHTWFQKLGALQKLNLVGNPYRSLGSSLLFQGLVRLRKLAFGSDDLVELRRGHLTGVSQLEELTVHANNLQRYDAGTLAGIWPLGRVTLSLHGPFLNNTALASDLLGHTHNFSYLPLFSNMNSFFHPKEQKKTTGTFDFIVLSFLTTYNLSVSDEAIVELLKVSDGAPLTYMAVNNARLTGEGRWERAKETDHKNIDEFFIRDVVILNVWKFVSFMDLGFLLQYPRRVSVIGAKVFLLPCNSTRLLKNLQYLDLTNNLLTDMTLEQTLCNGDGTLKNLRVLNFSGNALKSLSTLSHLVAKLDKLAHLDVSRNGYNVMPTHCTWPSTLQYLNISGSKLTEVTACMPKTLQVLDLSNNDLQTFLVDLPALRELYLSGNKLQNLPNGSKFPNLQSLTIQSNTLSIFHDSELKSYQRLTNLQAGQNKILCSCEFVNLLQMSFRGQGAVALTDEEENYICDSPLPLQGEQVGQVHLSIAYCHQVLVVCVCCGVALVIMVVLVVVLWRIHAFWYVKMTWAWLKAKRSSSSRRRRQNRDGTDSEPLLCYDAFVSYSERDASWVEEYLVPELENPRDEKDETAATAAANDKPLQAFSLCLHKRDFLPGQWIVDNIMSAMERSRRTVFILSENFVSSDWCRYELDFSHFRLFDGKDDGDTAILILLEPLSKDDIPKRFCKLRKLMNSTTYLEWPQEEEKRPEFWGSLRNALRGDDEEEP